MAEQEFVWPSGAATGVGSMPGTDPVEAVSVAFGEVPELPFLPELPARGPGAALTGRSAALLVDMPVDLQPAGWRFVPRPGRDLRRALDFLAWDLDALTERAAEYTGPLKVQVAGPWTLAATIDLARGEKALIDPGAVRDLAGSLAEGAVAHLAAVRDRVPGATLLLQLDEPSLPAVLAGDIPTASGFHRLRAVEAAVARDTLAGLIEAVGVPVLVHCCAPSAPVPLIRAAGAAAAALDGDLLPDEDTLGEALDAGLHLLVGVVPGTDSTLGDPGDTAEPVRALWRRLGFAPELLPDAVTLTPTCGLAGASDRYATAALGHCRRAARTLADA
ncbi:MAG: methionine synthase [Mycobacteriales bacterium]